MSPRVARLEGAERMLGNLKRIGRLADDKATLLPGAKVLKNEMLSRVPRLFDQLYDSIDIRTEEGRLEIGAGDEGFHGYFLERGTSKMSAQPWLAPSFDAGRGSAVNAIARKLGTRIDGIWGR